MIRAGRERPRRLAAQRKFVFAFRNVRVTPYIAVDLTEADP